MYLITLLYNKNNSLEIIKDKLFDSIDTFVNDLIKEIGQNNFDNILKSLSVPNNDKYLFNEFFNYIKYPSYDNFISKFNSDNNNNKEKYPLLNEYIKNESGPKNLKFLKDYNDFVNLMISYY